MSVAPPYFPMYVKDFLGDNRVDSMTAEELGAYCRLLLIAWQEDPAASLPPDEGQLARWARLDTARWTACRERVLACFTKGRDGRWHQKRLREEFDRAVLLMSKRSTSGKKGAEKRWRTHGNANGDAIDLPMAKTCVTGSGSLSSEGLGVRGEGEADFALTPAGLAQEWCFLLARRKLGTPRDFEPDVADQFAELVRLGYAAGALLAAVRDPRRDRTEQFWEFRDRLKKSPPAPPGESEADRKSRIAKERADFQRQLDEVRREGNGCPRPTTS